jgi:hypothetical protein
MGRISHVGEIFLVVIGNSCPVRDEIWVENESMPLLPTVPLGCARPPAGTGYAGIRILPRSTWRISRWADTAYGTRLFACIPISTDMQSLRDICQSLAQAPCMCHIQFKKHAKILPHHPKKTDRTTQRSKISHLRHRRNPAGGDWETLSRYGLPIGRNNNANRKPLCRQGQHIKEPWQTPTPKSISKPYLPFKTVRA